MPKHLLFHVCKYKLWKLLFDFKPFKLHKGLKHVHVTLACIYLKWIINNSSMCVCTCVYMCVYVCMRVCVCVCMCVRMCVCVCMCVYIRVCLFACAYLFVWLCVYVCIYICVFVSNLNIRHIVFNTTDHYGMTKIL